MPKFREITGQFVGYVPDGPDTDIVPDRAPMDGRVVFTPVFTGGVVAFPELVPPEFAHPKQIRAKIIDGFVRVEVADGDDVLVQPLSLMVTVDDEASQVWSWRAEFTNMRIGNGESEITIPSWSFRVPDGTGPVDLTELVPLKTSATVDVTKGPRGAGLQNITAQNGELVFEYTDGEETTIPVPEAVQGPQGEPGPAGADGAQGPEGPQGPAGEIPDLLVSNISDATPTGKNLMLAATEGAARNALGLAAGATAIAGGYSELKPGSTQTNSRVWSPKNISDYVESRVDVANSNAIQATSERISPRGQRLNRMDVLCSWNSRPDTGTTRWTQGFSIDEDAERIYVSAYDRGLEVPAQWVECRKYDGTLDWRTVDLATNSADAYSEGMPFYRNSSNQLCFILRLDVGDANSPGYVRTYNSVTESLSAPIPVAGNSKLFADDKFFYCATAAPSLARLSAFHIYTLASIHAGSPVLVKTITVDPLADTPNDEKPQAIVAYESEFYTYGASYATADPESGKPSFRHYSGSGRLTSTTTLRKDSFKAALTAAGYGAQVTTSGLSLEAEGLWPLRDGRLAALTHIGVDVVVTIHGSASGAAIETAPSLASTGTDWIALPVNTSAGVSANNAATAPQYMREGRYVTLRGEVKTTWDWTATRTLANLPAGFRPSRTVNILLPSPKGSYWTGYISTGGAINWEAYGPSGTPNSATRLSLDITFVADGS